MSDLIEDAVRAAFPDRTPASVEEQTTRPGNETALVRFEDAQRAYLKTATDTSRRLVRETAATRYADAHCRVGVPTVIAADPSGDPPYLATEPLPGTALNDPWTDGEDREPLLRQAGRAIAGIHEVELDEPGVIVGGDADGLDLRGETWTEVLCETVRWRATDWFADRFADIPDRLVAAIREIDPTLEDVTLLHADCSRINIHLDPDGLLDWERALVGDPAFDLTDAVGHLVDQYDVDEEEKLTEALYDGYRERAGSLPTGLERRRPLYWAIAFLLVPQTFEGWAAEVDQPNDELAANVREEFDSRLSEVRSAME